MTESTNGKRIINQRAALSGDMQGRYIMIIGGDEEKFVLIAPEIAADLADELKRMAQLVLISKARAEEADDDRDYDVEFPGFVRVPIIAKLGPERLN